MTTTITRKELAAVLRKSYKHIIRHETAWGLDKCKSRASNRNEYFLDEANETLLRHGVIRYPIDAVELS